MNPYYLSVPLFPLWPTHQPFDQSINHMTYPSPLWPIHQPLWTFPMTSITLLPINQPFDLSITTLTCPSLIWPIHHPYDLSINPLDFPYDIHHTIAYQSTIRPIHLHFYLPINLFSIWPIHQPFYLSITDMTYPSPLRTIHHHQELSITPKTHLSPIRPIHHP